MLHESETGKTLIFLTTTICAFYKITRQVKAEKEAAAEARKEEARRADLCADHGA